ncbi:NifU N-terminal domain-containing protein [Candidatus Parcubacteria bacterium]|nr:NifU N-terminal domain-containing protein [Candidatus Parcubacteria bacterium]
MDPNALQSAAGGECAPNAAEEKIELFSRVEQSELLVSISQQMWETDIRLIGDRIIIFESPNWRNEELPSLLDKAVASLSFLWHDKQAYWKEKEKVAPLIDALFRVDGVTTVIVEQYSLSVKIAERFDWETTVPQVERALRTYLPLIANRRVQ